MHRSLRPFLLAALLLPAGAEAAVFTGTIFRVTGVHVGGGAGSGLTASQRTVASVGQTAVDFGTATASFFLRPGFLQPIPAGSSGGGGVGGVDPTVDVTLQFTTLFGCLQVSVPRGCFSGPIALSISTTSFLPAASSRVARLNGTPAAVSMAANPALSPRKPILVQACYRDQDVAGLDESRLRLAVLPAGEEEWLPLQTSVDASANRAAASAASLGLWRVVEVLPAESPGGVVAFPNPLLPGQGSMSFTNLPAGARLRLYTFSGRPVRELAADATGRAIWDGRSEGGEAVASGTYFVFIDGTGGNKTVKVQVQR